MTEDTLVRSTEFTDRMENVRRMPASTPGETQAKKEAAQELRMNFFLDNANLVKGTIGMINENPKMTAEELLLQIQKNYNVTSPELTRSLSNQLVRVSKSVNFALEALDNNPEKSDEIARETYISILYPYGPPKNSEVYEPRGKIRFIQRNALAVGLEMENDEDYKKLHRSENAAGCFKGRESFIKIPTDDPNIYKAELLPVILISEGKNYNAEDHEVGHAENDAFMWSLLQVITETGIPKEKRIWGWDMKRIGQPGGLYHQDLLQKYEEYEKTITSDQPSKTKEFPPVEKLMEFFNKALRVKITSVDETHSIKKLRTSHEWKFTLDWALTRAKDEFLAEMKPVKGDLKWKLGHLKDGVLYNYFGYLGVTKGTQFSDLLWEDYRNQLDNKSRTLLELDSFYRNNVVWSKRNDLFRWVAAQIPVNEWNQQFADMGLVEEMHRFNSLEEQILGLNQRLDEIRDYRSLNESENNLAEKIHSLQIRINSMVETNCDKSLLSFFRQTQTELGELSGSLRDRSILEKLSLSLKSLNRRN